MPTGRKPGIATGVEIPWAFSAALSRDLATPVLLLVYSDNGSSCMAVRWSNGTLDALRALVYDKVLQVAEDRETWQPTEKMYWDFANVIRRPPG